MFEQTKKVMNTYNDVLTSAYENYEKVEKEYKNNYRGALLDEKLDKAIAQLNNTVINERQSALAIINEEFNKLFEEMHNILTEPAPNTFTSTLEAIRASKESTSDLEAEVYIKSYRKNYIACKALIGLLHEVGKAKNIDILSADAVQDLLTNAKEGAEHYIWNWDRASLGTALYLSGASPLLAIEAQLENFFNHDFIL